MMMSTASSMMKRKVFGPRTSLNQPAMPPLPRNCVNVGRIIIIDEAKMTGITPAMLTLSGMKVLVPPIMRRPTTRFAYCTGTRRSPVVIDDPHDDRQSDDHEQHDGEQVHGDQLGGARRHTRDDADEDDDRHAVADAARRDELAEPHHEHRARDEG